MHFIKYLLFSLTLLSANISLQLDSCYGSPKHIVINGSIMNNPKNKEYKKSDTKLLNFKRKFSDIFLHKAQENIDLNIYLNGHKYSTKTDNEGYFEFEADAKVPYFTYKTDIKAFAPSLNLANRCRPIIVSNSQKIGVIADFDDTLIVSNVTNKIKLFKDTFLKNYKQRVAVKGVLNRVKRALDKSRAFFVITGSPKQFNKAINSFLDLHKFPKRVLITKKLKGKNADPMFDQFKYKYKKIKALIKLYPQIKWTMFGDSGEKDLQTYKAIAKEYPNSVKAIFIRDVKSGKIERKL